MSLGIKVYDQAILVEKHSEQDSKDTRQAIELAQQVLAHCSRDFLSPEERSSQRSEDVRLKHLEQGVDQTIVSYNKQLKTNPPAARFHGQIKELDAHGRAVIEVAIVKYDDPVQARKVCERGKSDAREMMEPAKRALSNCQREGIS